MRQREEVVKGAAAIVTTGQVLAVVLGGPWMEGESYHEERRLKEEEMGWGAQAATTAARGDIF